MGILGSLLGRRGFGYLPDADDARDLRLGALLGGLATSEPPPSASLRHRDVGPKDQGPTESCTGQAWAQALRLAWLRQGVACPELSALAIYFWGRAEHGEQHLDAGSYLRTAGAAVMRYGAAAESAWQFRSVAVNRQPPWQAYRSAYDRRGMRGYYRVSPGDVDGVRRAIAAGFPVVGGWRVNEEFVAWNGRGTIPAQSGRLVGGHALPIVGYAPDGTFDLLNSWGGGWGQNGYAIVDEGFIRQGFDLWAVKVA